MVKRTILGRSSLAVGVVSFAFFFLAQMAEPRWGVFAVSAALAYVGSDVLLGRVVRFDSTLRRVRLFGRTQMSTDANGFSVFIIFVLAVSPLIAFVVDILIPQLLGAHSPSPWLIPGLLAAMATLALYADFRRQVR